MPDQDVEIEEPQDSSRKSDPRFTSNLSPEHRSKLKAMASILGMRANALLRELIDWKYDHLDEAEKRAVDTCLANEKKRRKGS